MDVIDDLRKIVDCLEEEGAQLRRFVDLYKELDVELDGVILTASAESIVNALREVLDDLA